MGYTIIRDSREKVGHGWFWDTSKYCEGTKISKLEQGDYTIEGYQDFFVIERKGGVSEFASNVVQQRFKDELERSRHVKHFWILLEFSFANLIDYPVGSGIPKMKWKGLAYTGPFIMKRVIEIQMEFPNVHIIPCQDRGKVIASSIFKRAIEEFERARANKE